MGLDMYAVTTPKGYDLNDNTKTHSEDEVVRIAYWRKHANLHGWMEDLYASRGGTETFNCIPLKLDSEDLDALESDMEKGLQKKEGFFWGESRPEDDKATREFITKAREAIKNGLEVYYDSWW